MKSILEFTMPQDAQDFEHARRGHEYYIAAHDFAEWLRSEIKHSNKPEAEHKTFVEISERFWDYFQGMI